MSDAHRVAAAPGGATKALSGHTDVSIGLPQNRIPVSPNPVSASESYLWRFSAGVAKWPAPAAHYASTVAEKIAFRLAVAQLIASQAPLLTRANGGARVVATLRSSAPRSPKKSYDSLRALIMNAGQRWL